MKRKPAWNIGLDRVADWERDARTRFVTKFGREPGPGELPFDEDADTPRPADRKKLEERALAWMIERGAPPHLIFAFRRTGLVVSEESYHLLPEESRQAWDEAMRDWDALESEAKTKPQ